MDIEERLAAARQKVADMPQAEKNRLHAERKKKAAAESAAFWQKFEDLSLEFVAKVQQHHRDQFDAQVERGIAHERAGEARTAS